MSSLVRTAVHQIMLLVVGIGRVEQPPFQPKLRVQDYLPDSVPAAAKALSSRVAIVGLEVV